MAHVVFGDGIVDGWQSGEERGGGVVMPKFTLDETGVHGSNHLRDALALEGGWVRQSRDG